MVLGCFSLIGCVFAFAFARQTRDNYVVLLALSVTLGAIFCTAAQGPLKFRILNAFSHRVTNTFEEPLDKVLPGKHGLIR